MDRRNPVCRPLQTLEDLLSWEPNEDNLCVAKTPIRPRKQQDGPKMLVCHDMKGGYLEDRLVQGCGKANSYRFYHWQYLDTFVYFSHHFVTIPPPAWTNTGHRHGVSVLGTLITEWNDGKTRCETFLKTEEAYKQAADQLVAVAKYYGFDGWLVNIENIIEPEELVTNLCGFVGYLTSELHKHIPGSNVIWYDSVLNTGKLDWQNALNDKNSMFFDVCDGIFLNYCWKDADLEMSKTSAMSAKRPYDVYVGIDVFGRGCLGDGGYNTREALEAARKHDLSAAIFGQGWVYETQGVDNFTENENKFWELLHDLCTVSCYTTLPVNTTFCQGFGERYFDNGIPVGNPWWNLNIQQLQPSYTQAQFTDNQSNTSSTSFTSPICQGKTPITSPLTKGQTPISSPVILNKTPVSSPLGKSLMDWSMTKPDQSEPRMDLCTEDSYIGGSCLKLEADVGNCNLVKYRLFNLDVELKHYSSVYVSVTYKIVQDPDCDLFVELHLKHDDQSVVLVLCPYPDGDKPNPTYGRDTASMYVHPLNQSDLPKVLEQSTAQSSNNTRWKTRWFPIYSLYLKFCRLKLVTVGLTTTDPQPKKCIALLGEIKIIPGESVPETFPTVQFISAECDTSTSYPLIQISKNNLDSKTEESTGEITDMVDWGVDVDGNPVKIPYQTLDKMRVSSHTLKEIRPGIGGQPCEVLYQLITSLDCFTIHWTTDNNDLVDHYRVYQIKIDSGVAKLLGHVTEPYYKVTWFEIPDHEKDEPIHHFKFVIRPVLKNGITVPLDYNYCTLFHVASKKDSVTLVKDMCTGITTKESVDKSTETNTTDDELGDKKENHAEPKIEGKVENIREKEKDGKEDSEERTAKCDNGNCVENCDNHDGRGDTVTIKTDKAKTENIENLTDKLTLSDE